MRYTLSKYAICTLVVLPDCANNRTPDSAQSTVTLMPSSMRQPVVAVGVPASRRMRTTPPSAWMSAHTAPTGTVRLAAVDELKALIN